MGVGEDDFLPLSVGWIGGGDEEVSLLFVCTVYVPFLFRYVHGNEYESCCLRMDGRS